jgi:type IV pilus assembly protein PilW
MRTSFRAQHRRGFTLAELLVGLAVTSIVMTAVVAIFVGVQRSYQAETEVKYITESGRGALLFIERTLPLAGYGIDPRVAFDVSNQSARDNQNINLMAFTPAQPALPTGVNGPAVIGDELAFRYRDPAFLRAGRLNSGNTTVTVDTPLGVGLPVNKLLMVGCRGGSDYAMVRVTTAAAATATSVSVSNAGAPFVASSANCLTGTGASSPWVFIIQEHRLRIVNLGGRPWLVSFRNLEDGVLALNNNNYDPIAPDVESFQVAFGMNRARPALTCCTAAPDTGGNTNHIVGDAIGETFFAEPANLLSSQPDYRSGYDKPERFLARPANIRSVHIAIVLRSSRNNPTGAQQLRTDDLFNYDAPAPILDGFKRSNFHTAIMVPNMVSRSGFSPALRTTAVTNDLNSWGG